MKYFPLLFILMVSACTPVTTKTSSVNSGEQVMNSEIYELEIKTVRIYPFMNDPYQELFPPVVEIGKNSLLLEFDDLIVGTENYYARLIHCNANWTKSRLSPLQYLDDFNEFTITDYEFSSGTKIPYVHYKFMVPQVKIPGNYILEVYRNTTDEVVMRQRIMYFRPLVKVLSDELGAGFNAGRLNQRINFLIDHSDFEIIDPLRRITVVVRQNNRWDNSVYGLKPTFIRQDKKELEYQYFDNENNFSGGNEFRSFDLRSINNAGANIQNLIHADTTTAVLMLDKPRNNQAYGQNRDLNGAYVIMNYDNADDVYGSDYVKTIFTLETRRKFLGKIYIHGALSNWNTSPVNEMKYNEHLKSYQGSLLLKQGWYDYQYLLQNDTLDTRSLEGQHYETENSYDILAYYRDITLDADVLIGYERWFVNPQF